MARQQYKSRRSARSKRRMKRSIWTWGMKKTPSGYRSKYRF